MPIRNSSRFSGGYCLITLGHATLISTAQRTASTALANSTNMPSPVVLTIRPRWLAIVGSTSALRREFSVLQRASLVGTHEPAVAGDIRGQNRREPTFLQLNLGVVPAHASLASIGVG